MHAVKPAFSIQQKVVRRTPIRSFDQCAHDRNWPIRCRGNVKNSRSIFQKCALFNRVSAPENGSQHFNPFLTSFLRLKVNCRKHNNISLSLIDPIYVHISNLQTHFGGPATPYIKNKKKFLVLLIIARTLYRFVWYLFVQCRQHLVNCHYITTDVFIFGHKNL